MGPFGATTHCLLTLEAGSFEFESTSHDPGLPADGFTRWTWFELVIAADLAVAPGRTSGIGMSLGSHSVSFELDSGTTAIDSSETLMTFGVLGYLVFPLGAGFSLGLEGRFSFVLPSGGGGMFSFGASDDETKGHVVVLSTWLDYEPVSRLSLRLGFCIWNGKVEWEDSLLFSPDSEKIAIAIGLSGPFGGMVWRF